MKFSSRGPTDAFTIAAVLWLKSGVDKNESVFGYITSLSPCRRNYNTLLKEPSNTNVNNCMLPMHQ